MVSLQDCFGTAVSLSAERLSHILEHPEMLGMEAEIKVALTDPELVRRSRTDADVQLYYRFYHRTVIGGKWLCVVVKYRVSDAFVVTAYLTNQPKPGEDLWPIK
jgi:hypothetical protein